MVGMHPLEHAALQARQASLELRRLPAEIRNSFLLRVAATLETHAERIHACNREDVARATQEGVSPALRKRLEYGPSKVAESARGLRALAALTDPLDRVLESRLLDDGLELYRVTVPIGVIAMIFESRPDALVQMAGLCWKSGNAVILKGGREAMGTNRVLFELIQGAAAEAGLPTGWIHLAETRQDVVELLRLDHLVDLVIPRGSNEFVRYIMDHTRIPVLGHADGIVHVYLHQDARPELAVPIVVDSKTQYPAVCNAVETLLIHQASAPRLLPALTEALRDRKVRLLGCPRTRQIVADLEAASDADWDTEYLDLILSIKVVDSLPEAVAHINRHGSHHTDVIVTDDAAAAAEFLETVDSADVFWNASSRFSDGYRYGLGAEVGIATGKLHARGPMGLDGLVTYQWRLIGRGHRVADYAEGRRSFLHRPLPAERYRAHFT